MEQFDVLVVGSGGAGMRAALGILLLSLSRRRT